MFLAITGQQRVSERSNYLWMMVYKFGLKTLVRRGKEVVGRFAKFVFFLLEFSHLVLV